MSGIFWPLAACWGKPVTPIPPPEAARIIITSSIPATAPVERIATITTEMDLRP